MAGIDLNRTTAGVVLPASVSNEVWDKTQTEESLVMRMGTRIDVAPGGTTTPTLDSYPEAEFVDETDEKPVKRPTIGSKTVRSMKLALIIPMSNEFRRDMSALYNAIARKLPSAIGTAFDKAVLYGPSPGTGFDTLASVGTQAISTDDAYADYLAALGTVAGAGGDVSAWVLSTAGEIAALGSMDGNGRPLFTSGATEGAIGSILGRPVVKSKTAGNTATTPDTVGFGGEWAALQYGIVSAITVSASDQATINDGGTQLNLWQRNMFALRVEAEVASSILDAARFVRLTAAPVGP